MYVLTYEPNVTSLPDWLATALGSAAVHLERLTSIDLPSPRGWTLSRLDTGEKLAATRSIFADTESCYEACDWAWGVVARAGLPPIDEWFDHSTNKVGEERIEFVAISGAADLAA